MSVRTGYFAGNTRQVQNSIKKRLTDQKNLRKAMALATELVRGEAVESIMRGAKTGTTYTKYNPRRTHTASAEGEAPASDTGNIVSGITTNISTGFNEVTGEVIANAKDGQGGNYAKHLEFGTKNMRPRPFLFPAMEKSRTRILAIFKRHGVKFR